MVLHPPTALLLKVVSSFHLNQDIVLPLFYYSPQMPLEKALHTLDVFGSVKVYLKISAAVRQSDLLFFLSEGPRKGQAASKMMISWWMFQLVTQAYGLKVRLHLFHERLTLLGVLGPLELSVIWHHKVRSARLQPGLQYIPL